MKTISEAVTVGWLPFCVVVRGPPGQFNGGIGRIDWSGVGNS